MARRLPQSQPHAASRSVDLDVRPVERPAVVEHLARRSSVGGGMVPLRDPGLARRAPTRRAGGRPDDADDPARPCGVAWPRTSAPATPARRPRWRSRQLSAARPMPNRISLNWSHSAWNSGSRSISGVRGPRQVDRRPGDDPARPRAHHGHRRRRGTPPRTIEWVTSRVVRRPLGPDALQLEVEPLAGHLVERAERLVEQQDLGLDDQRPGDGDPLAHAARQLRGPGVLEALEADQLDEVGDRVVGAPRHAADLERQPDVGRRPTATAAAPRPGTRCRGGGCCARPRGRLAVHERLARWSAARGRRGSAGSWTCRSPTGPSSATKAPCRRVEVDAVERDDRSSRPTLELLGQARAATMPSPCARPRSAASARSRLR